MTPEDRGATPFGRGRAAIPWVLFGLFLVVLTTSAVANLRLAGQLGSRDVAGFEGPLGYVWLASWIGFPFVGALITSRRRSTIGWLLLLVGLAIATAIASASLFVRAGHLHGGPPPGWVIWLVSVTPGVAFGLVPFAIDRFPEDRPSTGRWRHVVRLAKVLVAVLLVALAVRPTIRDAELAYPNPVQVPGLSAVAEVLITTSAIALSVFFVLVVIRAIVRFRRATGVVRAQLKWFVSALTIFPSLFVIVFAGSDGRLPLPVIDVIVAIAFFASLNGMAAAIGVAILRYRLFEIDRVVSRTVTYLLVSAALVGTYLIAVVIAQRLAAPVTEGSDLAVAVSTLATAALIQPIRRRVQHLVDRRFNRARYDAQRTVDDFSTSVRDEVDLADLLGDLRQVAGATVQPQVVTVWLRAPVAAP